MKLARLQIFRFAPSIRPDIEPVVSSANTSSTRGRAAATGVWTSGSGGSGARGAGATTTRGGGATARLWRWAPSAASSVSAPPPRIT